MFKGKNDVGVNSTNIQIQKSSKLEIPRPSSSNKKRQSSSFSISMEIVDEDWELVNLDGFIYRRPKRPRSDSAAAAPQPDPTVEAKARRERKKKVLLKLKAKYEQEIHHWEHLSNTFKAFQERTQILQPHMVPPVPDQTVSVLQQNSADSISQELTDNLLAQVEAQEAAISEASRLCDVVEALCDAEEQRLRRPLIDLPIWDPSPQELMASLLEE